MDQRVMRYQGLRKEAVYIFFINTQKPGVREWKNSQEQQFICKWKLLLIIKDSY